MQQDRVQILLSTYNGEYWLADLLESLRQQTWKNWQLLIRDDRSSDSTRQILQRWQQRYPELITVLQDEKHIGSKQSFNQLVELSDANYLMFCDQDDIWLNNKIQIQVEAIKEQEQRHNEQTALLVHSDMQVVDDNLKLKHSSFWKLRGFTLQQSKQKYLVQNVVSGNSCLFNRAAADLAFPLDQKAMEHDRWLALCVAWFGEIQAIHSPLLKYRQHANNQIGAFVKKSAIRRSVNAWSVQAETFLDCHQHRLTPQEIRKIAALAQLHTKTNWLQRRYILLKEKIRKDGLVSNLALLIWA